MLHKSGVTQSLARHIVGTRWDDIPSPVRQPASATAKKFMNERLA